MPLHRAWTEDQLVGYLYVSPALGHQLKHFYLARSQPIRVGWRWCQGYRSGLLRRRRWFLGGKGLFWCHGPSLGPRAGKGFLSKVDACGSH